MRYRPEIDGLRALAVVPVIFFHADLPVFKGGYVGVDIFFVISGYLITTIILTQLNEGRFSLKEFYIRRARRILPALLFVSALCVPFAYILFLPVDLVDFSESMVAVVTFTSNFLFWHESDYFGGAAELKPLLHTWSLAVEEQYYVLFPLFLILVWRIGIKNITRIFIILLITSLVISQLAVLYRPDAAFYLLPFRGWELLVGSVASVYLMNVNENNTVGWFEYPALIGLILIFISLIFFNSETPFPGINALLPVLGTMLIIIYGKEGTLVSKLLSTSPFVWIGLISYSAYLWHQPVLAFIRYSTLESPSVMLRGLICVLVFPLSYLSWKYIEQPFRHQQTVSSNQVVMTGSVFSCLIAFSGLAILFNVFDINKYSRPDIYEQAEMVTFESDSFFLNDSNIAPVILWGDSYAEVIAYELGERLSQENIPLLTFIKQSCPSLINVLRNEDQRLGVEFKEDCRKYNEQTISEITSLSPLPRYVVITSAYTWYLTEKNTNNEPILIDENNHLMAPDNHIPRNLIDTVEILAGAGMQLIIVLPHPRLKEFPSILRTGTYDNSFIPVDTTIATEHSALLSSALADYSVDIIQVHSSDILCQEDLENCNVFLQDGGRPFLWSDGGHLSRFGARIIAEEIVQQMTLANSSIRPSPGAL